PGAPPAATPGTGPASASTDFTGCSGTELPSRRRRGVTVVDTPTTGAVGLLTGANDTPRVTARSPCLDVGAITGTVMANARSRPGVEPALRARVPAAGTLDITACGTPVGTPRRSGRFPAALHRVPSPTTAPRPPGRRAMPVPSAHGWTEHTRDRAAGGPAGPVHGAHLPAPGRCRVRPGGRRGAGDRPRPGVQDPGHRGGRRSHGGRAPRGGAPRPQGTRRRRGRQAGEDGRGRGGRAGHRVRRRRDLTARAEEAAGRRDRRLRLGPRDGVLQRGAARAGDRAVPGGPRRAHRGPNRAHRREIRLRNTPEGGWCFRSVSESSTHRGRRPSSPRRPQRS